MELEKIAEGAQSVPKGNPKYSVCMINYNMEDTLEQSLESLLSQLDDNFEVVLIDDGSSDGSVSVIKKLQSKYTALKLYEYPRDPKRNMGATRNISIEKASGEYVLLHLDCDDVFGPYIKDFILIFHKIEEAVKKNILLSGMHINMGRRDFLLSKGPYRNIFYTEDRDMWNRLAAEDAYQPIKHVDFVQRLPRKTSRKYWRAFTYTWKIMCNDFTGGTSLKQYLRYEYQKRHKFSMRLRLYRALIMIPCYLVTRFRSPLPGQGGNLSHEEFSKYREKKLGTYSQIMKRAGQETSLQFLRSEARDIFA